ncbi:MAG: serine hydrolase domain-containing protein [Bryobacteraceae bacterium]|jgi:CubicO group peptidase (beta-lactamase class C family)
MIPVCCTRALAGLSLVWCLTAASLPVSKPEDVGLSSERLRRIHEMVMRHVDAHDISGAVTIVARKGRVVHYEAHGLMDIDSKKPMTRDALFRLASSSKPVTAAAVLILLEEGKLRLTDPVAKFIPEFRDSKVAIEYKRPPLPMADRPPSAASPYYTVPASRDITIVDLLTHGSGLASGGVTDADYQKIAKSRTPTDTLADFIPRLGALPLDFEPGTAWRYSPLAGFDTLGRIVEIVSGMSFDRFLHERLFEPLDMPDTAFNVPEKDAARKVTIYRRTETGLEKLTNSPVFTGASYFSGAGGLTSTAEDYYKFAQMLCNGGILRGKRILSPWTVDLMLSNQVGDLFNGQSGRAPKGVGFGLGGEVVGSAADARLRKPNGSYGWDGAFGTYWWVNRKEQMAVVFFIQTGSRSIQYDFDNAVSQAVIE